MASVRFQTGCRKRRLDLTLVFLCLFCVTVHFFWLVNVRFCCVRFSFSTPSEEIGLGTSPKWHILCRVGRKTLTQSISQKIVINKRLSAVITSHTVILIPRSRNPGDCRVSTRSETVPDLEFQHFHNVVTCFFNYYILYFTTEMVAKAIKTHIYNNTD